MKDELLRLAAICEKAGGPDREIDLEIAVASDRRPYWLASEVGEMWLDRSGVYPVIRWADRRIGRSSGNPSVDDPPRFTESIDAALTLVPEGGMWSVACMEEGPVANMLWPRPDGAYLGNYLSVHAATPALAICAASLRARASMENPQ